MTTCPSCKHVLDGKTTYCGYCGHPIVEKEASSATQPPAVPVYSKEDTPHADMPNEAPAASAKDTSSPAIKPMPQEGPLDFWENISYAMSVFQARKAYRQAIQKKKHQLLTSRKELERAWMHMGERARTLQLSWPVIVASMDTLAQLESSNALQINAIDQIRLRINQEETRHREIESTERRRIQAAMQQLDADYIAFRSIVAEQSRITQTLRQYASRIQKLVREQEQCRTQALKQTDEAQQRAFEKKAAEIALKIGEAEHQRRDCEQTYHGHDEPKSIRKQRLAESRRTVYDALQTIEHANQEQKRLKNASQQDLLLAEIELNTIHRQMNDMLSAIGKEVDAKRPQDSVLETLYQQTDYLRKKIKDDEKHIAELERERESYDHASYNSGCRTCIAMAIAGVLLILIFSTFVCRGC